MPDPHRRHLLAGGLLALAFPTTINNRKALAQTVGEFQHIRIPWVYTQTSDPTNPSTGTALLVDTEVTVAGGSPWGPQFQTNYFGARGVVQLEGLVRYGQNLTLLALAPVGYGDFLTVANTPGQPRQLNYSWPFLAARSIVADNATVTLIGTDVNAGGAAFVDSAIYATVDGGTLDGLTNNYEHVSYLSMPGLAGNTSIRRRVAYDGRATYKGVHPLFPSPTGTHWSGAGTFDATNPTLEEDVIFRAWDGAGGTPVPTTRFIGFDIKPLTRGTTNIGIRNASTETNVPQHQPLAAGTQIKPTARRIRLTATTPVTLTANPIVADGQDGQTITLYNTATNPITFTSTTQGLRLGAPTRILTRYDTLTLTYSTDLGEWLEDYYANNN